MKEYLYIDGCSFTWGMGLDNPPKENWGHFLGNKLELPVSNYSIPGQGNDEMFRKVYELFYLSNKVHGDRNFPKNHVFYLPNNLPTVMVIQLSELTRNIIFDDYNMKWKSANPYKWDPSDRSWFTPTVHDYYWKYYYSVYQNIYYLFVHMLLFKDKCDSLGIKFYVFDGICEINTQCLETLSNILPQTEKIVMVDQLRYYETTIENADQKNKAEMKLLDLYQTVKDKNFLLYNGDYSWSGKVTDLKKENEWYTDCHHPTKESHEFIANEIYNFIKESK